MHTLLANADRQVLTNFTWRNPTAGAATLVAKPAGDTTPGIVDVLHNSDTGYLVHLIAGSSFASPASLIALGMDNGNGNGLLIANKAAGTGITIDQRATVTTATGYGFIATQRSPAAPLVRLEMQATVAADVLQLLAFGTPTAGQNLLYVGDPAGQAGRIDALTGLMEWRRPVSILDKDGSTASYLEVTQNSGIAASSRYFWRQKATGTEVYSWSGSANTWWPFAMTAGGSHFKIQAGGSTGTVGTPGTLTNLIDFQNAKIGFFGATPVVQQTGMGAAATDAATTQTLANNLRTALINLGLVTA